MATVQVFLAVLIIACLVAAVHAVLVYNTLVTLRNDVARAWANIDVLLKQRHDEIPNLIEVCKGYMRYEQATLLSLAEARSRAAVALQAHNVRALGSAEAALRDGISRVYAAAEAYPDLKANETFLRLQARIS